MSEIRKLWKAKKITAKEAMEMIGRELLTANKRQTDALIALSAKIIDDEVPLAEVDVETDRKWWNETHPEPEND